MIFLSQAWPVFCFLTEAFWKIHVFNFDEACTG